MVAATARICGEAAADANLSPMSDRPGRFTFRGFDLRLANGFAADEARAVIERVLATGGDRVAFVMGRPGAGDPSGRPTALFVKAEFRRPNQPLGKRLKSSRAVAEGRGYHAFAAADVPTPRLFLFGEQSRLRPRAGGVVVTERVRGRNAAHLWIATPDPDLGARVARMLARIHAADLVHGDAAMRNFVLVDGREYAVDLPGWSEWTRDGAERDLARFLGSASKIGATEERLEGWMEEYAAAPGGPAARLADGWRGRVTSAAEEYRRHLVEREVTRSDRRARKEASAIRPRERAPTVKDGRS
jgi:tRNA A-37 threonylcarbamoyl transferase component Bud32